MSLKDFRLDSLRDRIEAPTIEELKAELEELKGSEDKPKKEKGRSKKSKKSKK